MMPPPPNNNAFSDRELGTVLKISFLALATLASVAYYNYVLRSHSTVPVTVTRTLAADGSGRDIYSAEDKRGLFSDTYQFIVAKNKADSAYAENKGLYIGKLDSNRINLSEYNSKSQNWQSVEIVDYKMNQ